MRRQLSWPSDFFSASLQPTDGSNLDNLVHTCHVLYLSSSPFLKDVPPTVFLRTPRPEYLTLAMASIGSLLSEQTEEHSHQLWNSSAHQLLGILEVDNSLARKTDLVKAVREQVHLHIWSAGIDSPSGYSLKHMASCPLIQLCKNSLAYYMVV
jgi:hypothetical protein